MHEENTHFADIRIKNHTCDLCDETFSLKDGLNNHLAEVHLVRFDDMSEKEQETSNNFQETELPKNQTQIKDKRNDECIDMKQTKKYQCQKCGKPFFSKTNLRRHNNTIHLGIKKFSCEFCKKEFNQKLNMRSHISKVHDKTSSVNK